MQLWLIPIFPLAGFVINGLFGRRFSKALINTVAIASVILSFAWASKAILTADLSAVHSEHYFTWIQSGAFRVDCDFALDRLTAVMLLVVTGIGSLIHIYSIGYMAHEGGYYRFFAYLNLFMFFMLTLVLAANYLVLFVGWEGVGLCSYLLIGFYFDKQFATNAGNKAFIVNRIGDFGFSLAMFYIVKQFGSLDFGTVFRQAPGASEAVLTTIGLLLLVGACGKSAQLPLYVWLPDAMAGPTPVSALIHAATMVTAGVYMTARSWPIYTHAPGAMDVIAIVGISTAFFAATIAFAQTDIKKVLAYSTISQLGYMFLGLGVGAPSAAIFHVVTHAFFKALLFLGAGSVIHALGGEQDMRRMGGLREKLPLTFWTMAVATLAIAGVPPFAGFFSKDAILWAALGGAHPVPAAALLGYVTAGMTAFYMGRLLFLTFFGTCRAAPEAQHHVHEAPATMALPLVVLAVLSAVGGFLPVPRVLEPILGSAGPEAPLGLDVLGAALGLGGLALAWVFYVARPELPARARAALGGVATLVAEKFRVDELYDRVVVGPIFALAGLAARGIDPLIDGLATSPAVVTRATSSTWRRLQTGNVQHYAFSFLAGALVLIGWYVLRR